MQKDLSMNTIKILLIFTILLLIMSTYYVISCNKSRKNPIEATNYNDYPFSEESVSL